MAPLTPRPSGRADSSPRSIRCRRCASWRAIHIRRFPQARWNSGAAALVESRTPGCLDASREFDQAFGLRNHPGKRELFATTPAGCNALGRAFPGIAVVPKVKVLGIVYNLTKSKSWATSVAGAPRAARRCARIRMAGGSLHHRRGLVRSLVLGLFAWAGGWNHMPQSAHKSFDSLVESALVPNNIAGRSRYLFWAVVVLEASIGCAFVETALRVAKRMATRTTSAGAA